MGSEESWKNRQPLTREAVRISILAAELKKVRAFFRCPRLECPVEGGHFEGPVLEEPWPDCPGCEREMEIGIGEGRFLQS